MSDSHQTSVSLSQGEKEAFLKGYNDYKNGMKAMNQASLTQPLSNPPAGFEQAYESGWKKAVEEAANKGRRAECLGPVKLGLLLLVIGVGVTALSFIYSRGGVILLAYGAVGAGLINILRGVVKYFDGDVID
jgi:hypothetical protein